MKLRATIALLAAAALLLGAAGQPERNTENLRDARKIRYGQRQDLAKDSSDTNISDPNQPLSLLPSGANPEVVTDLPNKAPKPGELRDGVTASAAIEGDPGEPAGTANGVRSLAIDGAPFGEVRRKSREVVNEPPLQFASNVSELPTLRGQTHTTAVETTVAAPSHSAALAARSPGTVKPAPSAQAASNQPAESKRDSAAAPAKLRTVERRTDVVALKPQSAVPNQTQTVLPSELDEGSSDEFKWVAGLIGKDAQPGNVSAEELRHEPTAAGKRGGLTRGTDTFVAGSQIEADGLEPLGIPGEALAQSAPGRLPKFLLGAAGFLALVLVAVVLPRPARRRNNEGLTLIETIGMDDERELIILRKKHYALVLGVTRTATHLLEKVSMASLDSDYSSVIYSIIKRESEYPELWRMRPLFSSGWRVECAPEVRAAPLRITSLSEMRASLQVVGPARAATGIPSVRSSLLELRNSAAPSVSRATMHAGSRDAVIRQLREQARRAS